MNLTRLSGALLAVALPFAVTGVASATTDTSFVTLTIAVPDSASDGASNTVELECDPAGGTHPNPKDACAELLLAQGDFDALSAHQEMTNCTMEYRPVIATADGTWHGDPISWAHEYGNPCTLRTATGAVFQF